MGALLVSTLNRLCNKLFYYFSAEVVTHLHPSRPNTAHLHPLARTLHLSRTQLMIFINVDVSNIYFTVSTLQTGTTDMHVANGFSTGIHGKHDSTVPYSRKIWRGIKFGGLAVCFKTAKLKSAKFFYAYMYVWRYLTIPPNLIPIMVLKTSFWGQTAKFNDRQCFRLYGMYFSNDGQQTFWTDYTVCEHASLQALIREFHQPSQSL